MEPEVAVIVVFPAATPVATFPDMVATPVFDEVQVAEVVRSTVPPPEMLPCAVNVCIWLEEMLGLEGMTVIDCRLATVTVTVVDPLTVPASAVIVAVPVATAVTLPEVETVAVEVSLLDQNTSLVRALVVPSS